MNLVTKNQILPKFNFDNNDILGSNFAAWYKMPWNGSRDQNVDRRKFNMAKKYNWWNMLLLSRITKRSRGQNYH